jgi:hypothetical protein
MSIEQRIRQLELRQPANNIDHIIKYLKAFNKQNPIKTDTEIIEIATKSDNVIEAILMLYDIKRHTT